MGEKSIFKKIEKALYHPKVENEEKSPQEMMRKEGQDRLMDQYHEGAELKSDTRETITDNLQEEAKEKTEKFAERWCSENKKLLEKNWGYSDERIERMNISEKMRVFEAGGGFKDLGKEKKYRKDKEMIETLHGLANETTEKEHLGLDSQYLALNQLNKKDENLKNEFGARILMPEAQRAALPEAEREQIVTAENKIKDLFGARKDLAEKITGRDLDKEFKELEEGAMDIGETWAIRNREVGELGRQATTKDTEAATHRAAAATETDPVLKKRLEDMATAAAADARTLRQQSTEKEAEVQRLERENNRRQDLIDLGQRGFQEREIRVVGDTPEKAKGGIEAFTGRIRERLAKEAVEEKVSEKKEKELENIKETLDKKGINTKDVLDAVHNRDGQEGFRGDSKRDEKKAEKFCKQWNIPFDHTGWSEFNKTMTKQGNPYEMMIKGERGWLEFWINYILFTIGRAEKREEAESSPKVEQ